MHAAMPAASEASRPAVHGGPVVEPRLAEHVEHAAGRAGLRVVRRVDHPRHARQHDRAGAHRARLERHVQHRVEQPPGAEPRRRPRAGRAPRRGRWGRRGARARCARRRAPRPRGRPRADRHVVVLERPLGLAQGQPHEVLVARKEPAARRSCGLHNFPMVKLFLRSYTQQPTVTQCQYASSP